MGDRTHRDTAHAPLPDQATDRDLLDRLQNAALYSDIAFLLGEVGLSDDMIATATGANTRTVARWKESEANPPKIKAQRERLDQLKVVVNHLLADGTLPPPAIAQWLDLRNETLQRVRPVDAIREGRWLDVIEAANAAWIRR
jgi:DNA-binding transcriptional regulator YiaG